MNESKSLNTDSDNSVAVVSEEEARDSEGIIGVCKHVEREKPWLSPEKQIEQLDRSGVKFELISKEEAEKYLAKTNNYYRIRAYRKGFQKVEGGINDGRYINLDFAMLKDLAIVDMLLRNELLPMTLDIEHFSKIKLMQSLEKGGDDGYAVVRDFLASCDVIAEPGHVYNPVKEDIKKGLSSPYTKGIIEKYQNKEFPVWAFLEVISFGQFVKFYKYWAEKSFNKQLRNEHCMLLSVKTLRNACAHNNCIINDMTSGTPSYEARKVVKKKLADIGISRDMSRVKLSNDRLQQIATTFYLHREMVSSGVCCHRGESLRRFSNRMNKNIDYYVKNEQVSTGFEFIGKMIEGWY